MTRTMTPDPWAAVLAYYKHTDSENTETVLELAKACGVGDEALVLGRNINDRQSPRRNAAVCALLAASSLTEDPQEAFRIFCKHITKEEAWGLDNCQGVLRTLKLEAEALPVRGAVKLKIPVRKIQIIFTPETNEVVGGGNTQGIRHHRARTSVSRMYSGSG